MQFVQRNTVPDRTNPYYIRGTGGYNKCILGNPKGRLYGNSVLPNCVGYAYGRFMECQGLTSCALSTGNAKGWYGHTSDGYQRGQTPRVGAVICWGDKRSKGAGHVAVVEEVYSDTNIKWSESNWSGTTSNGKYWRTKTGNPAQYSTSILTFQGYIYPVVEFDGEDTPPPEWIYGNRYLNESEMQNNATIVYRYLYKRGWTINAVAGLLGNMESESTINPAVWENLTVSVGNGYGLVQWTPSTNYTVWAAAHGYDITDGNYQLQWIDEETVSAGQWIATAAYPISFDMFKHSEETPEYLASAFLKNFERAGVEVEAARRAQARAWYTFLTGVDPNGPDADGSSPDKKKGYKWTLWNRRRIGV